MVAYNVCCEVTGSGNATESNQPCECVNECEFISFSTTISSGKLSPSVILDSIPDSSDIPKRFVAAEETRNRVEASLMIKTVSLLTNTAEVHRLMRIEINTDIVDAGTSWTTALSKLMTSLGNMMRGHIADSTSLLNILNEVYLKHVNYLVTGLSAQLQDCDRLAAEVHIIINRAKSSSISAAEVSRLQLLLHAFGYLNITLGDFNTMLGAEAFESSHGFHYFPKQLLIGDCTRLLNNIDDLVVWQLIWIESFASDINETSIQDVIFVNISNFRNNLANLSRCLLSYKEELDSFEYQLSALKLTADFNYEPPTTSLNRFNMDGQWLDSIASQYIANSLLKLDLATALHANGSDVLTNVDQLYSDIELSLFSKVSDLIDEQEENMVSFYSDLLQRVTSIQRYMFTNDTSLEQFMRRLSIWRMPILNLQKSQVLLIILGTTLFLLHV